MPWLKMDIFTICTSMANKDHKKTPSFDGVILR